MSALAALLGRCSVNGCEEVENLSEMMGRTKTERKRGRVLVVAEERRVGSVGW